MKLSCVSGSGYIDMSDMVRCTDPAAKPKSKIGPIIGGAAGGLSIILVAVILWYLRKKRSERFSLPYVTQRETTVEPSRFVDNGAPWHGMQVSGFEPLVPSLGSQINYDGPNLEPNALGRPILIAPQVDDFATSTQPSSWSSIPLCRNETDQTAIQDHKPTSLRGPSTLSRLTPSTSNLMPTPEADIPLRAEVTRLRAQMERMQSTAYTSVRPASLSDTELPPAYPRH